MGAAAFVVSVIFLSFAVTVGVRLHYMFDQFGIPEDQLVTGAVQINSAVGRNGLDLSRLNPASRLVNRLIGGMRHQPLLEEEQTPMPSTEAVSVSVAAPVPSPAASLSFEGHLAKKGENGLSKSFQRRYFVLKATHLYYFKAWEDYGSCSITAALNASRPILMTEYEVMQPDGEGSYRFDLAPKHDPLARKWQLQASSQQEWLDWIAVLSLASSATPTAGTQPTIGMRTLVHSVAD